MKRERIGQFRDRSEWAQRLLERDAAIKRVARREKALGIVAMVFMVAAFAVLAIGVWLNVGWMR